MSGINEIAGNHPEKITIEKDVITNILKDNSKITAKLGLRQDRTLYVGVICFLIWRILEMLPEVYLAKLTEFINQ